MLRVEHNTGVDLLRTTGAMDFDGGSLIVWRDGKRDHLVAAYGPASGWVASWEVAENEQIRPE